MRRARAPSILNPNNVRLLNPRPAHSAPLFCENGSWVLDTNRNCGAIALKPAPRAVSEEGDRSKIDAPDAPTRNSSARARSTASSFTIVRTGRGNAADAFVG